MFLPWAKPLFHIHPIHLPKQIKPACYSTGTNDAANPPRRSNFTSTELDLSTTKYCVANLLSYLPSAINVNLYFTPSGRKSNFIVFILSLCSALIPPMYHAVPLGRAITTSLPV